MTQNFDDQNFDGLIVGFIAQIIGEILRGKGYQGKL